jgi:hypothetical protein
MNSKEVEAEQTNAERAVAALQTYRAKADERNDSHSNPGSRMPYLDVDAVLARSLPKVTGETERTRH